MTQFKTPDNSLQHDIPALAKIQIYEACLNCLQYFKNYKISHVFDVYPILLHKIFKSMLINSVHGNINAWNWRRLQYIWKYFKLQQLNIMWHENYSKITLDLRCAQMLLRNCQIGAMCWNQDPFPLFNYFPCIYIQNTRRILKF